MDRTKAKQIASAARWRAVCDAIGARDGDEEHARLLRAWSSFGRRYHTVQHLAACLRELDGARSLADKPAEVEMALWFHDAIYRTYRKDNEQRSAAWATRFLSTHGVSPQVSSRVHDLIMATMHAAAELKGDAALVVDIDLSILGQDPETYDQFERNVRKEYWWVPRRRFLTARREILLSFLARPSIYHWPHFRERYETAARTNLQRAIQALRIA